MDASVFIAFGLRMPDKNYKTWLAHIDGVLVDWLFESIESAPDTVDCWETL